MADHEYDTLFNGAQLRSKLRRDEAQNLAQTRTTAYRAGCYARYTTDGICLNATSTKPCAGKQHSFACKVPEKMVIPTALSFLAHTETYCNRPKS